jgi:hypothetical protein
MSLSAKTLSPFMLWPGCCALPRQAWQAFGGGASNSSLPGGGLLIDTPYFVSPIARFSALHHAALGGSLELIALLLEAQATVDIKDSNGESLVYRIKWGDVGPLLRPW